jgi:hypothetical protein
MSASKLGSGAVVCGWFALHVVVQFIHASLNRPGANVTGSGRFQEG